MPHSPDDSTCLTPDQRRREVAAVLARGILRLQCILPPEPGVDAPEPEESSLEVPRSSRPHVTGR